MGLNKRQHDERYPKIIEIQDGEFCNWCGLTKVQLEKLGRSEPVLLIDHKNNQLDNALSNLQFLCRSCNAIKAKRYDPPRRTATPEMARGDKNMKMTRLYIRGLMEDPDIEKKQEKLEYYTLVDDIAESLDCSQQSIKNYLAKLTSKNEGSYEWETGNSGQNYLVPK